MKKIRQMSKSWPAARIIHLSGGCRAVNEQDPIVRILPKAIEGVEWRFEIGSYSSIYQSLISLGLLIVGVDFYTHKHEIEGSVPPNWRSYYRSKKTSWTTEQTAQIWRNIGHAGFKRKDGALWDTASRIGHQLRVCDWRLREISEAYEKQLSARMKQKDFNVGTRYEDGFTWLSYLSLQSFLVDACILRDYLAEFLAEHVYKPMINSENQRVVSMGMLKKKVLKKIKDPDPLTKDLQIATDDNGWLSLLGNYRNLVVHSAPLAQARAKLFSVCGQFRVADGVSIPVIRCPIPENPAKILYARSTGEHFNDFENQFNSFARAAAGDISAVDGVEYARIALGRLSKLADCVAEKSPVPPEMMTFDESNIIGGIEIKII